MKNAHWIMTTEKPIESLINLVNTRLQKFLLKDAVCLSQIKEKNIQGFSVFLFWPLSKDPHAIKEDFRKLHGDMKIKAQLLDSFQLIYCYTEECEAIEKLDQESLDAALSEEPKINLVATLEFPFLEMWKKKT